jgi:hypothetical protein
VAPNVISGVINKKSTCCMKLVRCSSDWVSNPIVPSGCYLPFALAFFSAGLASWAWTSMYLS